MSKEIGQTTKRKRIAGEALVDEIATISGRVRQVIRQAKARVLGGNTKVPDKIVSLFEPHTEIIRKGKASKPTEFGKMIMVQEAENQVIVDYQVFDQRPNDSDLLVPAVEKHEECFGRTPEMVAADAGFYSAANEKALAEKGIERVSVPNRNTRKPSSAAKQKQRLLPMWRDSHVGTGAAGDPRSLFRLRNGRHDRRANARGGGHREVRERRARQRVD